jgi:uncharacterized protein (DUF1330 family)
MPAYIIADVDVSDLEQYKTYMGLSPAAVAAAGGEFIVRGGAPVALEGQWSPSRVVILRFATLEAAQSLYDSPLYVEARKARAGATKKFNMILVEGTQ